MRDERLSSINLYFPREKCGCIYEYFFYMKTDGELILDVLDDMYKQNNIKDFMKEGYKYCLSNEKKLENIL